MSTTEAAACEPESADHEDADEEEPTEDRLGFPRLPADARIVSIMTMREFRRGSGAGFLGGRGF